MAAYANVTLVADTGDVTPYMGANVAAGYTTTLQDDVGMDAEAAITAATRYDWVTNFASLTAKTKRLLSEYVARAIAIAGILYDTSGYTSLIEAEDMVTYHVYRMQEITKLLTDQKTVTYMKA